MGPLDVQTIFRAMTLRNGVSPLVHTWAMPEALHVWYTGADEDLKVIIPMDQLQEYQQANGLRVTCLDEAAIEYIRNNLNFELET